MSDNPDDIRRKREADKPPEQREKEEQERQYNTYLIERGKKIHMI